MPIHAGQAHLMIVCERGGGDWPPLAALACALIARGHRVAAVCDRPIAAAFGELGASTIVVPDTLASRPFVDRVLETDIAPRALRGEPQAAWPDPCAAWAEAVAPQVADAGRRVGPDVVVSSIFGLRLGLLLRNMLGAPMVGLNPSFYLGPSAPRPFAEDYPGFGGTWFFEQCLLPPLMASDVVLHATDREFDLDFYRLPPDHHYVGPLLWDPPGAAPAYMDEDGPPWILASLSTIQSPDETGLLRAMLDAVAGLPARVLITAPDHGSEAAGNLPDNVRLERFVPHGPALRKSALMLSHAGHGAVIKALWHGVPMVLAPWDRDQPGVAHRAARLGAAIVVARNELTAERLRAALLQGLSDPALHAAAARHGARLRATDPTATACRILEDIPDQALRLTSSR